MIFNFPAKDESALGRQFSNLQRGQAALTAVLFFLIAATAIGIGFTSFAFEETATTRRQLRAKQSYFLAEAGAEDVAYRLKTGKQTGSSETLTINGETVTTSLATNINGSKEIIAEGNSASNIRKVKIVLQPGTVGVNFFYGVQVGEGGLAMDNNATINGNVYANGSIDGDNGVLISGDVIVASGLAVNPAVEWPTQNADQFFATASTNRDIAQSFIANNTASLTQLKVYLAKVGSPSSSITVRIATDNGGKPNTSSLASATIAPASVGATPSWITVTFATPPVLSSGTTYWIILDTGSNSSSNYWNWRKDSSDGYAGHTGRYTASWSSGSAVWTDVGGDLAFQVWIGGTITHVKDITVGDSSSGSGRANSFIDTTIHGSACPNSYCIVDTPPQEAMPISDGIIQDWKNEAVAGGICVPPTCDSEGNYDLDASTGSLGPLKVAGNLNLDNGAELTLNGTVWVTGTVTLKNNSIVRLSSGYGSNSGVFLADDKIIINNNTAFYGSGQTGSYVMLLSAKDAPLSTVMDINNNAEGVVYYAGKGRIILRNNAAAKEVTAYGIDLSNNTILTYDSGLVNMSFSSGPSGGWDFTTWREIE